MQLDDDTGAVTETERTRRRSWWLAAGTVGLAVAALTAYAIVVGSRAAAPSGVVERYLEAVDAGNAAAARAFLTSELQERLDPEAFETALTTGTELGSWDVLGSEDGAVRAAVAVDGREHTVDITLVRETFAWRIARIDGDGSVLEALGLDATGEDG